MDIKNFFGNYSITLINISIPVLTLPIVSNHLSKFEFGVYSTLQVAFIYIAALVDFGLTNFGTTYIAKNLGNVDGIVNAALIIRVFIAFISIIIFCIVFFLVKIPLDWPTLVLGTAAISIGNALLPFWVANGIQATHVIISGYLTTRILGAVALCIAVLLTRDLKMTLLFFCFGFFFSAALSFFQIRRYMNAGKIFFVQKDVSFLVKSGWSVASSSIISVAFNGSLILVAQWYQGFAAVAAISIVDRLTRGLLGLASPLTTSFLPKVADGFGISFSVGVERLTKGAKLTLVPYFLITILVALFSERILSLFGHSYGQYYDLWIIMLIWSNFSLANNFLGIQYLIANERYRTYAKLFHLSLFILILFYSTLPIIWPKYGVVSSLLFGEIIFSVMLLSIAVRDRLKMKKILRSN